MSKQEIIIIKAKADCLTVPAGKNCRNDHMSILTFFLYSAYPGLLAS